MRKAMSADRWSRTTRQQQYCTAHAPSQSAPPGKHAALPCQSHPAGPCRCSACPTCALYAHVRGRERHILTDQGRAACARLADLDPELVKEPGSCGDLTAWVLVSRHDCSIVNVAGRVQLVGKKYSDAIGGIQMWQGVYIIFRKQAGQG
jgi:hypothetical protein